MVKLLQISFLQNTRIIKLLLVFLISLPLLVIAQNNVVEIQRSTEKALIGGKPYFIHIVKKGQTLYSIAKAYNVTVNDILQSNSDAANELKVDQSLRIPEAAVRKGEVSQQKNDGKLLHVVSAGQTLYSISRIYGITVDDLEKTNPEVKIDSLQINQVLVIPQGSKKETVKDQILSNIILHKVAEKETVYSLAKHYGVSQDTILKLNENISKEGLKAGQEIKIPANSKSQVLKTDSAKNFIKSYVTTHINCDSVPSGVKEKKISISVMLPFSSGSSVTEQETSGEVRNEPLIRQADEINPLVANFIEFYQGILLALESFKNAGIQIDINVFDTERSTAKIVEILKNPVIKNSNFIIGPVYNEQVKIVAEFGRKNEIYVISPVSNLENALTSNPYFIQINPGKIREAEACINTLMPDTSKRMFAVFNRDTANLNEYPEFKKILRERISKDSLNIQEVTVFNNDFSHLKSLLDSLHENIIISPVTDEIFVSPLLGILVSKLVYFKISAVGAPEWINYSGIDLNYFFDLQLMYGSAYFSNYQSDNVINFLKKYRLYFGNEPVRTSKYGFNYSMLGYDIAYYFTDAYSRYGKDLTKYFPCVKYKSLVAPFNFVQTGEGNGFTNTTIQLIRYNKDYSIEVLKK